jgi:hypothetical protein
LSFVFASLVVLILNSSLICCASRRCK